MSKILYERNDYLLNSKVNETFENILLMSKDEFRDWCIKLRKEVVYAWDELGTPPVIGKTKENILDIINKMIGYDENKIMRTDELTGKEDVIYNTETQTSGVINGFFPTMMKVKINYTKDASKGRSIYDFFAKDELLSTFITYATRHFKRDSFYHYSLPIKHGDTSDPILCSETGKEWIEKFESLKRQYGTHDYWLAPTEEDSEYTGYNEALKGVKYLLLTKAEIEAFSFKIPGHCKTNINYDKSELYRIRYYEKGQKLFPLGFKAFRISYCQSPAQYPPLTAKYLWKRFTNHIKDQNKVVLYDPSAGWGGRLLGAMCINDRNIHYIGTDPNRDHDTPHGRTKYHEIADFVNQNSAKANALFPVNSTYEIWQVGSEDMGQYLEKNSVDMVFTSPPYFNREAYSEDATQSYNKFGNPELWRDGFLQPTLRIAVSALKRDRYLLWNLAPIKCGKEWIPLDEWSADILKSLGMEYKGMIKMSMAPMPGGNRLVEDEDGNTVGTTKNMCKVNGNYRKYEPIFVFYKP